MTKKKLLAGLILLIAGSLVIAACSAQQPTTAPTVDANAIYTQAAQTVQAGLSQTEAVQPTTPATETVAPTSTMDPSVAAAMTATAQSVQPQSGGQNANATATTSAQGQTTPLATFTKAAVVATATKAVVSSPPKTTTGDKGELVGQTPADGSRIQVAQTFDVHLTFKNTGTTTWTKKYALKFFVGDRLSSPTDVVMTKEVKPGDTIELAFPMKGSDNTGKKHTQWVLQNADGVNFYTCWLDLEVIN